MGIEGKYVIKIRWCRGKKGKTVLRENLKKGKGGKLMKDAGKRGREENRDERRGEKRLLIRKVLTG